MANIFKDEYVPNEEDSTGHKNWAKANKGEAAKWAAFRDAAIAHRKGEPPVPVPAMATKHGKALVAAGKEHMSVTDIGSVVPPTTPPPSGYLPEGGLIIRTGNSGDYFVSSLHHYAVVVLSPYQYSRVAQIKANNPNCKVICYTTAADARDLGTGSNIPSQSARFTTDTCMTYNEILNHDALFPADKWVLTTNGTTHASNWGGFSGVFGGNIGKTGYINQCIVRLQERLSVQPGWDGFFVDNAGILKQANGNSSFPFESQLNDETKWTAGQVAWCQAVRAAMNATGRILAGNVNYYLSAAGDNGSGYVSAWNNLAPVLDITFCEVALQTQDILSRVKLEGTAGYTQFWQVFRTLTDIAQNAGSYGSINMQTYGVNFDKNGPVARYCRATAMLRWNGSGVCWGIDDGTTSTSDPWTGVPAQQLGQPAGQEIADNGCYKRQYQNGWVAVNPSSSSKTITVGSTSRTIPSGDAFLGAS